MTKNELELLYSACEKRIDAKISELSATYGGKQEIVMADLEKELLDCQNGGMPLDIRTFRAFLRRLGAIVSTLDNRLDKLETVGTLKFAYGYNDGDIIVSTAISKGMTYIAFESSSDIRVKSNDQDALVIVHNGQPTEGLPYLKTGKYIELDTFTSLAMAGKIGTIVITNEEGNELEIKWSNIDVDIALTIDKSSPWGDYSLDGYDNTSKSTWQFASQDKGNCGFNLALKHTTKLGNVLVAQDCSIISVSSSDESVMKYVGGALPVLSASGAAIKIKALKAGTAKITIACDHRQIAELQLTATFSNVVADFAWSDGTKNKTIDSETFATTISNAGVLTAQILD